MKERKAIHTDIKVLAKAFDLLASEAEAALPSVTVCEYEPGEVVLKEGDSGDAAYVALKGRFTVRKSQWLFLSKEVAKLEPGNIFGEIGFLMPTTRSASILADGPCEAARLTLGDFKGLLDKHPQLRARIEEMARRRLYSLSASTQA